MNKEELKTIIGDYLKENLTVSVFCNHEGDGYMSINVGILLDGEEIANQSDKTRNKMNVLAIEGDGPGEGEGEEERQISPHDCIIKSGKIICPECKEDIKFSIDDYVEGEL